MPVTGRPAIAALALAAACRAAPPPALFESDPAWAADGEVPALELRVALRDRTPSFGPLGGLPAGARPKFQAAREQPAARERWLLAGARAAFLPAPGSPLPAAFVLREGAVRAAARAVDRSASSWPLRRLADLVEGGVTERFEYLTAEHVVAQTDGAWQGRPLLRETLLVRGRARTGGRGAGAETELVVWFAESPPAEAALARLAMRRVALAHLDRDGLGQLAAMRAWRALPVRWRVTTGAPERGGPSAVLEGEVESARALRVPRTTFRMDGRRRAAPPAPPVALAVPAAPDGAAALRLRNRTPHHLWALLDGVRVATVLAGSELDIPGLVEGYYRLGVRSPLGTFAAPARDLYVPGVATFE